MALRTERKKPSPAITTARRTQVVTTYGIGGLIPIESESFIVLGQNMWPERARSPENAIYEPGLAKLLGVNHFYQPPSGEFFKLPLRRFPEVVTCPRCNRLDRFWLLARKDNKGDYRNECRHCEVKTTLMPSRFIAACPDGHIQDFPYQWWVHEKSIPLEDRGEHKLKLINDAKNSTLAGLIVRCSCGQTRSMAGALGKGLKSKCFSSSPWLIYGPNKTTEGKGKECSHPLTGLQRGASNVWYPDMKSVIRIDRDDSPAEKLFERYSDLLGDPSDEDYQLGLRFLAKKDPDVTPEELRKVHLRSIEEFASPEVIEARLRDEEYEALKRDHPEVNGDELFVCKVHQKPGSKIFPSRLSSIVEVPRLRVVNALTSFTRVEGISDERTAKAKLSTKHESWLPAIEIFGEGIFIELDKDKLRSWERSEFAQERVNRINRASAETELISPRFLLLHSLSHALMMELSLQTGYPATSIKERVYAMGDQAGILLYTASADSAGSLGGLTSHGKPAEFSKVLRGAIEAASWCSADPVCIEADVHGVNWLNLAACHYCMLAPEVSCEHSNGHLDRATLVGHLQNSGGGFFGQ